MTDEKYVFISDVKEKKDIGRSGHNKRTHTGKGGRVRLPSDYLSQKERNAMNGEVKSYRMNDPLSWAEFKAMPDDLKINYIKMIRSAYGVSDNFMAKHLFKASQTVVSKLFRQLGIALGKGSGNKKADKEGFLAWCNGVPLRKECAAAEEMNEEEAEVTETALETACKEHEAESCAPEQVMMAVPASGTLTFKGNAASALATVIQLLGEADAEITVSWKCRIGSELLERMVDDGK